MIVYKYLPSKFAQGAVNGRLKISLLSHFQRAENSEIRDAEEGLVSGTITAGLVGRYGSPDLTRRLAPFIRAGDDSQIALSNVTFALSHPPIYILSLSLDPTCEKWLEGPEPYDAIISVADAEAVAAELSHCHSDKLGAWAVKPVSYTKRSFDLTREDFGENSPFDKSPFFADESELRICWMAIEKEPAEYFISDCPRLRRDLVWAKRSETP